MAQEPFLFNVDSERSLTIMQLDSSTYMYIILQPTIFLLSYTWAWLYSCLHICKNICLWMCEHINMHDCTFLVEWCPNLRKIQINNVCYGLELVLNDIILVFCRKWIFWAFSLFTALYLYYALCCICILMHHSSILVCLER